MDEQLPRRGRDPAAGALRRTEAGIEVTSLQSLPGSIRGATLDAIAGSMPERSAHLQHRE